MFNSWFYTGWIIPPGLCSILAEKLTYNNLIILLYSSVSSTLSLFTLTMTQKRFRSRLIISTCTVFGCGSNISLYGIILVVILLFGNRNIIDLKFSHRVRSPFLTLLVFLANRLKWSHLITPCLLKFEQSFLLFLICRYFFVLDFVKHLFYFTFSEQLFAYI